MNALKKIAIAVMKGELVLSSDELAAERLKVCEQCEAFRRMTRQCAMCSCFMDLKTKILDASCPQEFW